MSRSVFCEMPPVLVVEPSAMVSRAIVAEIERAGLPCTRVSGFAGAVESIHERVPSALVSSHQLDGLSGCSLRAALLASPTHRGVPFAMVACDPAAVPGGDRFPVFEKGPRVGRQVAVWLGSLRGGDSEGAGGGAVEGAGLRGLRVLLAEDTASMRRLLSHKLHLRGASVTLVVDGFEASVAGLRGGFDLIVLDIEMPRLDGRDAMRILRDQGVVSPVLALTAHDDHAVVEGLLADGFGAVIPKAAALDGLDSFVRGAGICRQAA